MARRLPPGGTISTGSSGSGGPVRRGGDLHGLQPEPAAFGGALYLADIPLRLAHCRENPYRQLTDRGPDPEPGPFVRHEVRRQLDLVADGRRPADAAALERLGAIPATGCAGK